MSSCLICCPQRLIIIPLLRLDEYIRWTLYGTKKDTAKPPFKSLQQPEPHNGVRMTLYYYNQSYFPYDYTEQAECGVVAGLNYNWVSAHGVKRRAERKCDWALPSLSLSLSLSVCVCVCVCVCVAKSPPFSNPRLASPCDRTVHD